MHWRCNASSSNWSGGRRYSAKSASVTYASWRCKCPCLKWILHDPQICCAVVDLISTIPTTNFSRWSGCTPNLMIDLKIGGRRVEIARWRQELWCNCERNAKAGSINLQTISVQKYSAEATVLLSNIVELVVAYVASMADFSKVSESSQEFDINYDSTSKPIILKWPIPICCAICN